MPQTAPRTSFLLPFRTRSFRFQWPADLLTSWAQEMEVLILTWYILTETGSVVMLALFAGLPFLGTLLAPIVGSIADLLGRRAVLCWLRLCFVALAGLLMVMGLSGTITPGRVFAVAVVWGLLRPSDMVLRHAMIGDTIAPHALGSAMGLNRLNMDSARIAGALAGAGLFATLGFGPAYVAVVGLYVLGFALTLGTSRVNVYLRNGPFRILREVREGLAFTWRTPDVKALMVLAFMVNLLGFPIHMGLLPFAARDIFGLDETGLGKMTAMFGFGAILSSLLFAATGGPRRHGHNVMGYTLAWFVLILVFAHATEVWQAHLLLWLIGLAQGIAMLSLAVALLETAAPAMRGRVLGVRMLAVYGLPVGLALGGALVELIGYQNMVTLYGGTGVVLTIAIAAVWRGALFR